MQAVQIIQALVTLAAAIAGPWFVYLSAKKSDERAIKEREDKRRHEETVLELELREKRQHDLEEQRSARYRETRDRLERLARLTQRVIIEAQTAARQRVMLILSDEVQREFSDAVQALVFIDDVPIREVVGEIRRETLSTIENSQSLGYLTAALERFESLARDYLDTTLTQQGSQPAQTDSGAIGTTDDENGT